MQKKEFGDTSPIKVFGAPLQNLYRALLRAPSAPRQPELIRSLSHSLEEQGLSYHPRTLKRQLLGSIEYIPEPLEKTLVQWIEDHLVSGQKKLIATFLGQKEALESSNDDSLYVPPAFLNQMADAYLFRHKDLSRRKLALKLGASLQAKGISIGLETLQAALSGKTQKVRKVLEEELLAYFREEGLKDRNAVETFLKETENQGGQEVQKIEVGDLSPWADAYLMKHRGLSKRQLALRLQKNLQEKGYVYHLSSLQSVLEGKTHKTRKVIADTLQQLLLADGLDASERIGDFVNSGEGSPLEWNHYVSAESVPNQVETLLQNHPGLTRRQVALQLREDLAKKEFHFSLSTLQYLLAGKTQRIKKVVADLLEDYLQPGHSPNFQATAQRGHSSQGGSRQALEKRVEESQSRYQNAVGAEKEQLKGVFLKARWDLIRKVSMKRNHAVAYPASPGRRSRSGYEESGTGEAFFDGAGDHGEISVAYDVREAADRLVS